MTDQHAGLQQILENIDEPGLEFEDTADMPTMVLGREQLLAVCLCLRDQADLNFDMLIDVCGVDYLDYGITQWDTQSTSSTGFSRAAAAFTERNRVVPWDKPRFAVVYHLLSISNNHRVRLKVYLSEVDLQLPSVVEIWNAANWFEREAYDLFGIAFNGHPDLRRLLTDYGFKGHPLRKDFPLVGEVEMRYDATLGRCVYEPVSIQNRVLVAKVIRDDNRYQPELAGHNPEVAKGGS